MWVGYNLGCTMGFLMGHSAWQIDQFPTCWPMNGLFVHWSRGWGVSSFSERLVDYVPIIVSFFRIIIFRSYHQWEKWRLCKRSRSKVKVTEVNTQLSRFRTVTPVWIHIWWWNGAQSLMLLRRGIVFQCHPSNFKVIRLKNRRFWPKLGVSGL